MRGILLSNQYVMFQVPGPVRFGSVGVDGGFGVRGWVRVART